MNKEERLKAADEVFDACFDFKEVPLEDYTTKLITNDIKIALNIAIHKGAEAEAESNKQVLSETLAALNWMWENMEVTNKNLQSDSFNIPANAIATVERALGIRID